MKRQLSDSGTKAMCSRIGCVPDEILFTDLHGYFKSIRTERGLPHWLKVKFVGTGFKNYRLSGRHPKNGSPHNIKTIYFILKLFP